MGRRSGGYSLLELLAAIAAGGILMSLCMVVTGDVAGHCQRIRGGVAIDRGARRVMVQLREDLSSWVSGQELLRETLPDVWRKDRFGFHCLLPTARQPDDKALGDLCAVVYRCEDLMDGDRVVRCLTRSVVGSADVYQALAGKPPGWVWSRAGDPGGPLATGVVSFQVERMMYDPAAGWRRWVNGDPDVPDAHGIRLVLAGESMWVRLSSSADWDRAACLGNPESATQHPGLQVYHALIERRHRDSP